MLSHQAFCLVWLCTQAGDVTTGVSSRTGFIGMVTLHGSSAIDSPDSLAQRKQTWERVLEGEKFRFSEANVGILYALSQYSGDCQIHMIHDAAKRPKMTFRFVRNGKEILVIDGHTRSTFLTSGKILYFAHCWPWTFGCTVTAYDLTNGEKIWERKLKAVGEPSHSAYRNEVTMALRSLAGVDQKGEGSVAITGRESYGDDVEILDQKTGTLLAHKIYRQGFGSQEGNKTFKSKKK